MVMARIRETTAVCKGSGTGSRPMRSESQSPSQARWTIVASTGSMPSLSRFCCHRRYASRTGSSKAGLLETAAAMPVLVRAGPCPADAMEACVSDAGADVLIAASR